MRVSAQELLTNFWQQKNGVKDICIAFAAAFLPGFAVEKPLHLLPLC